MKEITEKQIIQWKAELDSHKAKLKPRPVVDVNDPNKWFWEYIEKRQKEQIEEELNW